MHGQFFNFKHARLHFTKVGTNKKNLLLFHGFGQDHQAFKELEDSLKSSYTIFSFDIFFHGRSKWEKGEEPLEKIFWKVLLIDFLKENEIDSFSLLGFSMGGKFVFATLEAFPEKTESVILLAPDGIKTNFWYSLATYPTTSRKLFKSMINKPQRFKAIENFAVKIGLIDRGIVRFIESQMNNPERRSRVYLAWVVFRYLKFDMSAIANLINSNKIKVTVIVGKYDKIITTKNMHHLLRKLDNSTFEILETGHNGVIQESIKVLGKLSMQIP
jgi:pimeloyl-ACP methyl ester carboxylesterase